MWISVVRKIFFTRQKKKIDSNSSTSSVVVVFAPFIIIPLLWCWKETNNNKNDAFDEFATVGFVFQRVVVVDARRRRFRREEEEEESFCLAIDVSSNDECRDDQFREGLFFFFFFDGNSAGRVAMRVSRGIECWRDVSRRWVYAFTWRMESRGWV